MCDRKDNLSANRSKTGLSIVAANNQLKRLRERVQRVTRPQPFFLIVDPVQQPEGAYAPLCVSTPEATALDLVGYAPRIGGIERAHETLVPLLPIMRILELRRALVAERSTTSAQRLGYLLERSGADRLADVVHEWLPANATWCSLGPGQADAAELHRSERWHVLADARGST